MRASKCENVGAERYWKDSRRIGCSSDLSVVNDPLRVRILSFGALRGVAQSKGQHYLSAILTVDVGHATFTLLVQVQV